MESSDMKATMIDTHVLNRDLCGVMSLVDLLQQSEHMLLGHAYLSLTQGRNHAKAIRWREFQDQAHSQEASYTAAEPRAGWILDPQKNWSCGTETLRYLLPRWPERGRPE